MSMRIGRILLLALVAAASVVVLVPSTAFACSCSSDSWAGHVDNADLVVRGTIKDRDAPLFADLRSDDSVTYTVAVSKVFKGESGGAILVESAGSGASCGLEVEVGRDYVLFANAGTKGVYDANLCGGTSRATASSIAKTSAITGRATPPDKSTAAPADAPSMAALAVGGFAAAVLGAGFVVLRRRRG